MKLAKWIWLRDSAVDDSYAEFIAHFSTITTDNITLDISFDTVCNIYINGELVFFGQCADYPFYKKYHSIDISQKCHVGENELSIFVWYFGEGNATYYKSNAGVIFEVSQNTAILLASSENTLSRPDTRYKNGYKKLITSQMGYSYYFDNTVDNALELQESAVVKKSNELNKSCICLELFRQVEGRLLRSTEKSMLFDLGQEECGFLTLDIESEIEQLLTITYGEHIADESVRRFIGDRDFSVEIRLKKGQNRYENCFRRIAGRYIEVFFEHSVKINSIAIKPVVYHTDERPIHFDDPEIKKIYNTAVRTLKLCMHEHYEDCPWREQAMYTLDSRNQMLCGYHAFGNFEYARENIVLMSKGINQNGLLELTYPAKNTPAIPLFSLMYPVLVDEYVKYSKDISILKEIMPAIQSIMHVFSRSFAENGMIPNLPYPFWNFYEWSDGSDNAHEISRTAEDPYVEKFDLILNCAYIIAVSHYSELTGESVDLEIMRKTVHDAFYVPKAGLFKATIDDELYTELGNAMAILSGVAGKSEAASIAKKLLTHENMVEATLSMMCFKYDALLAVDEKYSDFVISDIKKNYSFMLEHGATSFWETINGESDFGGAGSLCHSWSALPVYYFNTLL